MWWTSQLSAVPSPRSTTPWRKSSTFYWQSCKTNLIKLWKGKVSDACFWGSIEFQSNIYIPNFDGSRDAGYQVTFQDGHCMTLFEILSLMTVNFCNPPVHIKFFLRQFDLSYFYTHPTHKCFFYMSKIVFTTTIWIWNCALDHHIILQSITMEFILRNPESNLKA